MNQATILEMYDQIKTVRGVAKALAVDRDYVSRILAQNGIIDFLRIEDCLISQIMDMYSHGSSIKEIHNKLGVASKKIAYVILSKQSMRKRTPKLVKQEDFFCVIDTEEKAYWLGFLYADGYVGETNYNIELTLKDRDHVVRFKDAICPSAKVYEKNIVVHGAKCTAYRVNISSKRLIQDLVKHGCVQAKSLILEWPLYVPDHLTHHFVRGYFDGDGTVGVYTVKSGQTTYAVRIMGTEKFLGSLSSVLRQKLCFTPTKLLQKANNKALCYCKSGKRNVLAFREFIYKDASVFLPRKKEIFDSI